MESERNCIGMLSMFPHPVFLVKDEIILAANASAQALQIRQDTPVFDLLRSGQDEYRNMENGSLSLTVGVGPITMIAAVVRVGTYDFFHLLSGSEANDLKALALASQHLRDPLSNIIALTDNLFDQKQCNENPKDRVRIAQLNQNLHRLMRSVGNMSDAYGYADKLSGMETVNIAAVITDAVEKTQQHFENPTHLLTFTSDGPSAVGIADQDQLERAVYNLLSNALRYSDPDSAVTATLKCDKDRIRFTVENRCAGLSPELLGTVFFHYRRTPTVTDGGKGLGLGIPIVQAVASAHKGSLLATLPEPGKIRFCLTIPVIKDSSGKLRSPILRPDYAGGYDRSLIELSDLLPNSAYKK